MKAVTKRYKILLSDMSVFVSARAHKAESELAQHAAQLLHRPVENCVCSMQGTALGDGACGSWIR
jgi:hypothetical protein